jgi:hypothetical protein
MGSGILSDVNQTWGRPIRPAFGCNEGGRRSPTLVYVALAQSVIELVNRQGATEGRVWLLKVLHELDDLECIPLVPPAQDLRYIG